MAERSMATPLAWSLASAVALLFGGVVHAGPAPAKDAPLATAAKAIRREVMTLRNITVHSTERYWGQVITTSGASVWVPKAHPITDIRLTDTLDGLPDGCFMARVLRFTGVQHPRHPRLRYNRRCEDAYNGRVGTYLCVWLYVPGHGWENINSGRIYGGMPAYRHEFDQASGWAWTTFGFTGSLPLHYHPLFSRFITPGARQTQISAKVVQWHGNSYLRVDRYGPPTGRTVFLLNPRHGYAIAQYKFYGFHATKDARGKYKFGPGAVLFSRATVDGFWDCGQGIFYPKRIGFVQYAPPPQSGRPALSKPMYRAVIRVRSAVINRPGITRASYVVQFPAGAQVHDMATGRYIRIVGTAKQQLSAIERAVKAVRDQPHATGAAGGGK